ncbi:hypothetical protein Tco_0734462 [Tanacetum coccineum]
MADENVPALDPTRSDDQILPFATWVPIGKSNYVLDLQKKQKNPIFQISVDILQNINFFRAFTASASLDETRFVLDDNLMREALAITPIDQAHQFVSPPSGDAIMDFVNELGYTEARLLVPLRRAGKTRSASPFHLVEEDLILGNLKFVPKGEEEEVFGMPIPNELISNNIKNAPYYNVYLEMVAKHDRKIEAKKEGKKKPATVKQPKPKPAKEKSSKSTPAPKPKVTKEKPLKPSPAKHPKRGKVQKLCKGKPSLQLIDEDEPTQPELEPEPKPEPEHQGEGDEYDVERAIQMSLESFQAQSQAHVSGVAIREPVAEATRPLPMVEGKGNAIATEEQAAQSLRTPATEEASTGPSAQPQDDASANIVCESPSLTDAETGADTDKTNSGGDTKILQIGEEQGDDVTNLVNLEEKTIEIDEGQAGSDPGKTPESRPPPDDDKMDEDQAGPDPGESHVALAGPNPEPTHDEFMANVYPNVHESLKFPANEHAILKDLLSSTGTLSSMKNLDDAFTIGDQFINDKSTEDEPKKLNVEVEVVSMVTVPIYQASSSIPPLSTPIIDLSSPSKLVSSTTQAPIFTATTTTTSTTLPPPPQQQSTTESELVARVATLEHKFSGLEQKSKNLDNTTQNLGSRVFTLELQDLPYKINQTVNEVVKEAVHVALQAPLRDRFRELPKADMKEILHQRKYFHQRSPQSLAWKKSDTREAHSSSSKQKSDPDSKQPVEDVSMPDTTHPSDSKDTNSAHLQKIKPRPEWLKPILEEYRPATPEPDWSIPTNDLPKPENNRENALAKSYKDPKENKLLRKTGDMGSFITWFCKRIGKKKLRKIGKIKTLNNLIWKAPTFPPPKGKPTRLSNENNNYSLCNSQNSKEVSPPPTECFYTDQKLNLGFKSLEGHRLVM